MIDKAAVFEIIRLKHLGWSDRKIARHLCIDRSSVKKYAKNPDCTFKVPPRRASKLEPYVEQVQQWLDQDPEVAATVVLITIVRDLVRRLRGPRKKRQAYLRFESEPGAQMQIDWGHFGSLAYGSTHRKLYALAVVEAYSRMLYVEFTHSQNQYSLHRCLLNAFMFFGGCPKEVLVDNMVTAWSTIWSPPSLNAGGPWCASMTASWSFCRPLPLSRRPAIPALPMKREKWKTP